MPDDTKPKVEIYYPYDTTSHRYAEAKAGLKRAQAFCDSQNQLQGANWVIHTKAQHDEWWNREGRAQFEAEVERGRNRQAGQ